MYILNGKIQKTSDKTVSPLSQAFMFGYGLFETLKVVDGEILFFSEHINRLRRGTDILKLKLNWKCDDIFSDCKRLIELNKVVDGVLKLTFAKHDTEDYLFLTTRENSYKSEDYKRGFKMMFSEFRRNKHSLLVSVKSNNYLENIIEKKKASELGFDEILFLNTEGHIAEGAVSNVFWIKGNTVFTPSISCGLLPGIVREKILFCIDRLNMRVSVGEFEKSDMLNAEEVFITNSIMNIMPVSSIEDKEFSVVENSVTRQITDNYKKLIGEAHE